MTSEDRSFFSVTHIALVAIGAAALLGAAAPAAAQENQTSPPAPLEFPFQATVAAPKGFALSLLRYAIETSGDQALCSALMQVDGKPVPQPFEKEDCLPAYKQKVANNSGAIHWASNSRPLSCGASCFGRPFMLPQENFNRPNLRQARLFGRLSFILDGPGADRGITYFYDAFFTCKAENGAREGKLVLDIKFGDPVLDDPGMFESFVNVFTLGWLTDRIDQEIKKHAPGIPGQAMVIGPCRSVGVDIATDPKFDMIRYDEPAAAASGASAAGAARAGVAATTAAIRDTATIRFQRIVRNPLPVTIDPGQAHPGDFLARQFSVFVNGQQNFMPPGGLDLPPEGGSATISFCKTIDLTGANQLQIIFINDLGGAAWSQFTRGANFGSGGARTMTTSRTIILPGRQGPTGFIKPGPYPLREFELTYDITFSASATTVGAAASEPSGGATTGGAVTGGAASTAGVKKGGKTTKFKGNVAGALGKKPEAVIDATPAPCVQL